MTFVFVIGTLSKDLCRKNQNMKMLFSIKEEPGMPATNYIIYKVYEKMNAGN
jgi:hypothetical protein